MKKIQEAATSPFMFQETENTTHKLCAKKTTSKMRMYEKKKATLVEACQMQSIIILRIQHI